MRPSDISFSVGDPAKAEKLLGWTATTKMPDLVGKLVEAEMVRRSMSAR
jgi:GDPmannose 4,6-dehydratase